MGEVRKPYSTKLKQKAVDIYLKQLMGHKIISTITSVKLTTAEAYRTAINITDKHTLQ